jgi:hypothetical protein
VQYLDTGKTYYCRPEALRPLKYVSLVSRVLAWESVWVQVTLDWAICETDHLIKGLLGHNDMAPSAKTRQQHTKHARNLALPGSTVIWHLQISLHPLYNISF